MDWNFLGFGKSKSEIYDIYVVQTSGLPLFAGCTGSAYCMKDGGHHELISGFFSAMFAFSEESFNDQQLQEMNYDNISLNFQKDRDNELIFAFVHNRDADQSSIRKQLEKSKKVFLKNYSDHLDDFSVDQSKFDDYTERLISEGVIDHQLMDTTKESHEVKEEHSKNKNSLVGWIKHLF